MSEVDRAGQLRSQLKAGNAVVRGVARDRGYRLHPRLEARGSGKLADLVSELNSQISEAYAAGWHDAMHYVYCAVEKHVPLAPPTIPIDPRRKPRRNAILESAHDQALTPSE